MMDKVSAYSFGSAEVRGEGEADQSAHAPLLLTHEALVARVQPMEAEILRLKSLCLVFADRLAQLEGSHADEGEPLSREHGTKHSPSTNKALHAPTLAASKSASGALKRRLSEEQPHESSENNNSNESRAYKKKRT